MVRIATISLLLTLFLTGGSVQAQPVWEPAGSIIGGDVSGVVTNAVGEPVILADRGIRLKINGVWSTRSEVDYNQGALGRLARSPSGLLYFGAYDRTWMSADNGRTWGVSERVDGYRSTMSIDAIYSNSDTLITHTRSTDDGTSWQSITPPFAKSIGTLIASDNATTIFARGRSVDSLAVSTDRGGSWHQIEERFGGGVLDAVVPGPSMHFIATYDATRAVSRLFRSADEGVTWQMVSATPDRITSLRAVSSSIVIALRSGRPFRSTDGGSTWSQLSFGSCPENSSQFESVYSSPGGMIYLGSASQGLWSSSDQGDTWSAEGVPVPTYYRIVARSRGSLFMNGGTGGWESNDNGSTWSCNESVPEVIDSTGRWFRTYSGLEASSDHGHTWTSTLGFSPSISGWRASGPVVTPRGTILAAYSDDIEGPVAGVVRTTDGTHLEYPLLRSGYLHAPLVV
jgi:hypothetical protein